MNDLEKDMAELVDICLERIVRYLIRKPWYRLVLPGTGVSYISFALWVHGPWAEIYEKTSVGPH